MAEFMRKQDAPPCLPKEIRIVRRKAVLTLANAQLAVSNPKKHPEFAGNVKTIEARGFWKEAAEPPTSAGYHYETGNPNNALSDWQP